MIPALFKISLLFPLTASSFSSHHALTFTKKFLTTAPKFTTTTRRTTSTTTSSSILRMSSLPSPAKNNQEATASAPFPFAGKTLLSIQECLEAHEQESNQNQSDLNNVVRFVFLDASSWHKGREPNAGRKLFEQGPRILGSRHFDIADICLTPDLNSKDLPYMIPTPVSTCDNYIMTWHCISSSPVLIIVLCMIYIMY